MVENHEHGDSLRFTLKSSKPLNQSGTFGLEGLNKPIKPLNYSELREKLLKEFKEKQLFRVTTGKTKWVPYESFNESYNQREILKDEIVIEFDSKDLEAVMKAISQTGINLLKKYTFEYWDHGGKSPHLHIRDLPIAHLNDNERAIFKKMFIKKYVPLEYLNYVDFSLTGTHLIALEWANHWKGHYGIKRLISVFM